MTYLNLGHDLSADLYSGYRSVRKMSPELSEEVEELS